MAYLRKSDVLASFKTRVQRINGSNYTIYEAYMGVNPLTKKPERRSARTPERLREVVADFYKTLADGGDAAVRLNAYQAMDAKSALDLLAQAKSNLTLTDCVRRALEGAESEEPPCTVTLSAAFAKYAEQQEGKSEGHRAAVRTRVGGWVARFGGDRLVSEVTAREVAGDLEKCFHRSGDEKSKTTYNNNLGYIKTFMAWCAAPEQKYVKENPVAAMKPKTKGYVDPEYMKADEVEKTFRVFEKRGGADLAYAILSFFCGMRQAEIQRAAEGERSVVIDLNERYIRIIKVKGHLRGIKPRAFTIPEQALAWMRSMPDFVAAARTPNRKFREHLVAAGREAGVAVPENAGRHTFCTMFEAAHHDTNALSAIVGNTEDIRDKHYNGVAKPQEGRDYFAILPSPCRPT